MPAQVRAAEALLANGKADEARYLLETALARLGPDRVALVTLARCYDALRRPREADEARRRSAVAPSH
jgi:predicted Zn-dependent protease